MHVDWSGVYPAVSTQFHEDFSLNIDGTCAMADQLIADGVHGLIAMGTVGENYSLSAQEKRELLRALLEVVNKRVPVLSGVAEITTHEAQRYANDAQGLGADGLMVLPGLIYASDQREAVTHFRSIARASTLPVMIYNNPVSYTVDLGLEGMAELADEDTIVAIKESTTDTRRITELQTKFAERFIIFCGVDDIALESILLGATGWISGLTNVFPKESLALFHHAREGNLQQARDIYRWFMPLLRLDTVPKLVQCIKYAEALLGRGSETVRPPRLSLIGNERAHVKSLVDEALATRPNI